jgi:hypothetical protein
MRMLEEARDAELRPITDEIAELKSLIARLESEAVASA